MKLVPSKKQHAGYENAAADDMLIFREKKTNIMRARQKVRQCDECRKRKTAGAIFVLC